VRVIPQCGASPLLMLITLTRLLTVRTVKAHTAHFIMIYRIYKWPLSPFTRKEGMNQSRNYVLYMHQQISSSVSCHRVLPHVTDLIIHSRSKHEQHAIPPGMVHADDPLRTQPSFYLLTHGSDGLNEEGMTAC
jgi:hypothetical protein